MIILGPKLDRGEAEAYMYEKMDDCPDADIVELNTRNKARATSQIKAMRLNQTSSVGSAVRHARHRIPSQAERERETEGWR